MPPSSIFVIALALLSSAATYAAQPIIPPAPGIDATSYLLIDAHSQKVLIEHNSNEQNPPASLTKIMTSYLAEKEIEAGRIHPDDQVLVSVEAWRKGGSKMFIREGTRVSVGDLLRGIIIQSGNDASVAIAEHIAGSESAFADMMNQQAAVLGLTNTNFRNSTGLPADDHYSSAWDLAMLTRALIEEYPEHYALYSERSFIFNEIEQANRNKLLWRDRTVDGVKTGYTSKAGYCLVASAVRDGMRLISVVMGTDSDRARMQESQKLLSYGFRYFETQELYPGETSLLTKEIFYSESETLDIGVAEKIVVTFPRGYYNDIETELKVRSILEGPVKKGDEVGKLYLRLHGETFVTRPLVALEDAPEAGMFSRFGDFIYLFFAQLLGSD
ncbi:MAG: D-alanyl-D-alanine carboxypeptidase family protein [Pseudomonadota bacterium]